jgi:hypothetical protein
MPIIKLNVISSIISYCWANWGLTVLIYPNKSFIENMAIITNKGFCEPGIIKMLLSISTGGGLNSFKLIKMEIVIVIFVQLV